MFFTQEDYLKIEKWLKARAIKDSQFPELTDYDQPNSDDYFVILQGNKTNAKVKATKAFLHIYRIPFITLPSYLSLVFLSSLFLIILSSF